MTFLSRSKLALLATLLLAACSQDPEVIHPPHVDGGLNLCAGVTCDAPSVCQAAGVCNPDTGSCEFENFVNGTVCDDGDACTTGEACSGGQCLGGSAVVCQATGACQVAGTCNPETGCEISEAPDGTECDDQDACTSSDVCAGGACVGEAKSCAGSGECMVGQCSPATGECQDIPVVDGTECTTPTDPNTSPEACEQLACGAGACIAITKLCPSPDDCHGAGTCNETTGECENPELTDGTTCDDGNVCTDNESCTAGVCGDGSEVICPNLDNPCLIAGQCVPGVGCIRELAPDGVACDDGDKCTHVDICSAGQCVGTDPEICVPEDPCHMVGVCQPESGLCTSPPRDEGDACDDGDACTEGTRCHLKQCVNGTTVTCRPAGPCEVQATCDSTDGCLYSNQPNGGSCEDGDGCTENDTCLDGTCTAGTAKVCVPSDAVCDTVTCDPDSGTCVHVPLGSSVSCDDQDPCTVGDACRDGECRGGGQLSCPPTTCRQQATCGTVNGQAECGGPPVEDGTTCTLEITDPCSEAAACTDGECLTTVRKSCDAIDSCHGVGSCDSATGECTAPVATDDARCSEDMCFSDITMDIRWETAPIAAANAEQSSVAILDYNQDGFADIAMVTDGGLLLLENHVGEFTDVTSAALLTGRDKLNGLTVADYDNDGWPDIYLLKNGTNELLRNRGGVRASSSDPVTFLSAGLGADDTRDSHAASFGDYNNDGRLDVYVGNYGAQDASPSTGAANGLFEWNSTSGRFEDVASTRGVSGSGATLDVLFTDLGQDGDIDILTCNDDTVGPVGSRLFEQTAGSFSNGSTSWSYSTGGRCRGLALGDYNLDGVIDYYLSKVQRNSMLRTGASLFAHTASSTDSKLDVDTCPGSGGLPSWSGMFADLNSDGRDDLFVVNGDTSTVPGTAAPRSNALLSMQSDNKFDDVAATAGVNDSRPGRAAVAFDFDNDGDLDLFVANAGATAQLLRNERATGGYLRVWLRGRSGNRDGIGARVSVTSDFSSNQTVVEAVSKTLSGGRLLFGTPDAGNNTVDVVWPSGTRQHLINVASDEYLSQEFYDPTNLPGVTVVEPNVTLVGTGTLTLASDTLTVPVDLVNAAQDTSHSVSLTVTVSHPDWTSEVSASTSSTTVTTAATGPSPESTNVDVTLPSGISIPDGGLYEVTVTISATDTSSEMVDTLDGTGKLAGVDWFVTSADLAAL